ncbi:DUF7504 family protein [Halomicrococcus sp. NG-SE-24]|uniref:DUF7504 family protein n=1 Tax=Halomicrococcus sp. NG-SE-24 TaxID=3436928 RepID=UPI003D957517
MKVETTPTETGGVLVAASATGEDVRANYLDLLADREPAVRNLLAITYAATAEEFLARWHDSVGDRPANVGVVDVGETMRSTAARAVGGDPDRNVVRSVERPRDFDATTAAVEAYIDRFPPEGTVLVCDSLTVLLDRVGLSAAISFVDDLMTSLAAANAVGYFVVDPDAHDDGTLAALDALFDAGVDRTDDVTGWTTRSSDRDSMSLDVVFDVLSVERRRHALRHLFETADPDEAVDVSDLARAVARRRTGASRPTRNEWRREEVSLYQFHLPKLASAGFLDHDADAGWVTLRDRAQTVRPFLALVDE